MSASQPENSAPANRTSMPWCSVIIPTLNEAEALPATLRALRPALQRNLIEIIVADGGSTDDTLNIARAAGCSTLHCSCGRATQMNAGSRTAQAPYLWFLHADTVPPQDWQHHLRKVAETGRPASFRLRFTGEEDSGWLRLFGRLSHLNVGAFRFGDQSLFIRRADFEAIGGYREEMQLLEDNDIVRRAGQRCGGFTVMPRTVTTSSRRYQRHGIVYTQSVYVLLYTLYRLSFSQATLSNIYRRAFKD